MKRPWTTWLVRGVWVAAMLLTIAAFALAFLNPEWDAEDALFVTVGLVLMFGYATVGALIASRHPTNAIGWLLLLVASIFALNALGEEYVVRAYLDRPPSLPFSTFVAWFKSWTIPLGIAAIPLLLLLFPSGLPHRAAGRRCYGCSSAARCWVRSVLRSRRTRFTGPRGS